MKILIREQHIDNYKAGVDWDRRLALWPTVVEQELTPETHRYFLIWFEWYFQAPDHKPGRYLKNFYKKK